MTQEPPFPSIAMPMADFHRPVKTHMGNIFEKLGVEGRNAATLRSLEVLSAARSK
jgi:hypothetical protein